jgi:IclR family transcriptional regulator, KDG regulon repressor
LINSLARGLQIVQLLAQADGPLGVTQIGERLGVDPSTSYRLLATLERHGFVQQEPSTKKYGLGFGVLQIASALLRRLNLAAIASPHLRALAAESGEGAHVAVRDATRAVFVARESATGVLRVEAPVGSSEPVHCTAAGKALLLDMNEADLAQLFGGRPLERYTPQTITDLDLLVLELQRSRDRGYAFDDEELHPGVRCLAAPVRDHVGRIVASLGLSAPATRLTRDRIPALVAAVRQTAHDVSSQLGYPAEPIAVVSS